MFVIQMPPSVQVPSPRAAGEGQVRARRAGPPEEVGEARDKLLPRRLFEHFRPVPRQKLRTRQTLLALRPNQTGAVVGEQLRLGVVAAQ